METLDQIAIRHCTDKSSLTHDYMRIYEPIMQPVRMEVTSILEIGIGYGASARMWLEYFPNATVYVIDIDDAAIKRLSGHLFNKNRLKIIKGDQSDPNTWESVPYHLDFVIDDGSHVPAHQIASFDIGFNKLKTGGYWFIEDTHCNFHYNFSAKDELYPWLDNKIHNQQMLPADIGNFYVMRDKHNVDPVTRMIYGIRSYKSMIVIEKAVQ